MNVDQRSSSGVQGREWVFVVVLLLLAWGLRLWCMEEVPPGWRDDELINIHALSSQVLDGEFPIYYLGASGHEPLYHHLHAGVHAVLGFNVLSGHILSVVFGTLSIALTYSLVRRMFPRQPATAVIASLTLTTSFWSLMYSRTAIRHVSALPFVLATLYALWRCLDADGPAYWQWGAVGLLLGISLYTYTAVRLVPVLIACFVGYLALFRRECLQGKVRGVVVAFVVMACLVTPMAAAIVQGRSTRAIEGIGADARVIKLATPWRALRRGEIRPLLVSVLKTLGMFHASGDPEWLYNIPGRSVFNVLGGVLLWIGVALCLRRWREPRYFFLLPWLGLGLSPAFVSTPPASLSHTIVAQPVVYVLPALALAELSGGVKSRQAGGPLQSTSLLRLAFAATVGVFVVSNAIRDVRDYFVVWPDRGMVQLLYRGDQREAADYIDAHPEVTEVAVGSALRGPWDRIAMEVDIRRDDVAPRLFNPERALTWPAGEGPSVVLLPSWPDPAWPIDDFLGTGLDISPHVDLYSPPFLADGPSLVGETEFENGLTLEQVRWLEDKGGESLSGSKDTALLTMWRISRPLDLPPSPVVAHPAPPETYTGSRLAVLAHLVDAEGKAIEIDDGLWVDPLTLQPGDRFVQVHRLSVPEAPAQPHILKVGLYDPKTNRRWHTLETSGERGPDAVSIRLGGQQ